MKILWIADNLSFTEVEGQVSYWFPCMGYYVQIVSRGSPYIIEGGYSYSVVTPGNWLII